MTKSPTSKRLFPKRVFRHLVTEYLALMLCCLVGFLVLFLVADIFNELEDFLDAGTSAAKVAAYFLMRQPANLVYILPASILLSLSFVVNNLIRHQELTAIRAAGISIPHAMTPVWIIAVLLAGAMFVLNEYVGPRFTHQADVLRSAETEDDDDALVVTGETHALAYRNRSAKRDWFFELFDPVGRQRGVSVKQHNPVKEGLLWEIRAAEADYGDGRWVFFNGRKWTYGEEDLLPVKEERFEVLPVSAGLLDERPGDVVADLRPLRDMAAGDIARFLKRNPDLPKSTRARFKATFWYRLTFPAACLVASLYGVSMMVRAQRAGAFNGFAKALGLLFAYVLVTQIFLIIGKQGFLPGFLASALPNAAFLGHGLWMTYKRR
ncbi:MAG: LptF/LptG family permease [Lentisphaeria bacterium]|nr:LptF/LptG family permease [Lentisphaeria bacterium]